MTEEKEKTAAAPRSWWQELFDHILDRIPSGQFFTDSKPTMRRLTNA